MLRKISPRCSHVSGPRPAGDMENSVCRMEILEPRVLLSAADVVISEFMAINNNILADEDGDFRDWIEIYNSGQTAVNLEGWYLTDDLDEFGNPDLNWQFPNVTIEAGEYMVIFASSKDRTDPTSELHTDFNLSGNGEYLALIQADGVTVNSEFNPEFPEQFANQSYGLISGGSYDMTVIGENAPISVLVPASAGELDGDWNDNGYVTDGNWIDGTGSVGYENGSGYESYIDIDTHSLMYGSGGNTSAFTRQEFTIDDASSVISMLLHVRYDDGFVAYLNGVQVAADNEDSTLTWDSSAPDTHSDSLAKVYQPFDISAYTSALVDGVNVLAVHAMNESTGSSDFLIQTKIDVTVVEAAQEDLYRFLVSATPGYANSTAAAEIADVVEFSVEHGIYTDPISVALSTATVGADIYYTTNGSVPSPNNGTLYTGPIGISTTTTLRAAAYKTGYDPSVVMTQTYLYLAGVPGQDATAEYPSTWGGATPDYWMDPDVLTDPRYDGDVLNNALTSLPTMSIVVDIDDFFDYSTGIYSNPTKRVAEDGPQWEKAASIEYFDPNNPLEGFQINAGIRIQGGASRSPNSSAKHSMRLTFKSDFGPTKLEYPLFGEENASEFDQLILRAGYGHSWMHSNTFHDDERGQAQYIKDEFARQTQELMGQPAAHGMHVQLYINGMYWGVYNTTERPNSAFAASYLGGSKEDYETLNAGEPLDGDGASWQELLSRASLNLANNANYAAVEELLDIDNFIDFNILNIWGGNDDWDTKWIYPGHNWYAVRELDGGQFKFMNWDSEHLFCDANTDNIEKDQYGNPLVVGGLNFDLTNGAYNDMSDMYRSLMNNAEFRLRFADHLHKYFFNDGLLTSDAVIARYTALADGIETALVGESARWGDWRKDVNLRGGPYVLYTVDDYWIPRRDYLLNDYFPYRSDIVLQQFRDRGLYPALNAPSFNQHGGAVTSGFDLTMSAPAGTIYYTEDGSDPRYEGGAVSPDAIQYTGSIDLTQSRNIKARVYQGGQWSALNEAAFEVDATTLALQNDLRITELMYNPISGDDMLEFIEFTNLGSTTLDLTGVSITDGVDYTFAGGITTLAPGERIVVLPFKIYDTSSENLPRILNYAANYETQGVTFAPGFYTGVLNDGGETIVVETVGGEVITEFTYNDSGSWPGRADGKGSSLELIDAAGDLSDGDNWRSSTEYNGTPGYESVGPLTDIVINEILTHTDLPDVDAVELYNTSNHAVDVSGWFLSDSNDNYLKYEIPAGTVIEAGEYLVIDENDFNPTPMTPGPNDFSFNSAHGDDVYLTIGNGAGLPAFFVDDVDFGAALNGISFGRSPNGNGKIYPMQSVTLWEANSGPLVEPVIISEIMYHTVGNVDDLEYIELYNNTESVVDMSGWQINGGIDYEFAQGILLDAHRALLVVSFEVTDTALLNQFTAAYTVEPGTMIVGGYSGKLSNDGEKVELYRPDEPPLDEPFFTPYILVDEVRYNDALPWPLEADGLGKTLNRIYDDQVGDEVSNWQAGDPSPGAVDFVTRRPGDTNGDGKVDLLDLVTVGENWNVTEGATWEMGDFNGDGRVDLIDLVTLGENWDSASMVEDDSAAAAAMWPLESSVSTATHALVSLNDLEESSDTSEQVLRLF